MKRISKKTFIIVYIQFLISAASVWMILGAFDSEGNMNTLGYVAGALFWLGLLGGTVSYVVCFRKVFGKPNVLKFFSNEPAFIADGLFIISLAAIIFMMNQEHVSELAELSFMFLLIISLYSHFLLNGKIFTEILIGNNKKKGDSEE